MNPLIDKLPTKIRIDNQIYDINADFRNCLKIILAYEDNDLTLEEKHLIMLKRLYKTIPNNIEQAIIKGIKFLNCGEEKIINNEKRTYSFQKDSKYIYTAVSQSSRIDLETIDFFHWWKFCYYFMDIDKDCSFSNIVGIRQKRNMGKLSDEEKRLFIRSREIFDLDYELEEEESEFMKKFNGGD